MRGHQQEDAALGKQRSMSSICPQVKTNISATAGEKRGENCTGYVRNLGKAQFTSVTPCMSYTVCRESWATCFCFISVCFLTGSSEHLV